MKNIVVLALAISVYGCAIFVPTEKPQSRSTKVQLAKLPKNFPEEFHTGLVIAIAKEGPLVRDPMEVSIKNLLTGEIVKAKAAWGMRTGIALTPSEYSIRTWVPYMGKDIWETKIEAIIDSGVVADLTFTIPVLISSQAVPHLSPYRANKESRQ